MAPDGTEFVAREEFREVKPWVEGPPFSRPPFELCLVARHLTVDGRAVDRAGWDRELARARTPPGLDPADKDKGGVGAVRGEWPGGETDAEVGRALEELDD